MDFTIIEKHPLATGGIVIAGGLALYLYWRSGTSAAASVAPSTVGTGVDPASQAAAIALAQSLQSAQASTAQQTQQLQYQLDSQAADNATQITLAQINAKTSTVQQVNQITGAQNLANTSADLSKYTISSQEVAHQNDNATQIALAQIADAAATTKEHIDAATAVKLAGVQADAYTTVAGYGASIQMAQVQSDAATKTGIIDLLNKGALGNGKRASVAAALVGSPAASVLAQPNPGNSAGAVLSGIANLGSTVVKGLFGG